MSYRVRIESFEGPFDLLLYLVSRQKVDIGSISIAQITDQYLDEVRRMRDVDLDVASDFLLVASTLLEIKAASLLPQEKPEIAEDLDEYSPSEMGELLVNHLIEYKKFKNAAFALLQRAEAEERLHVRSFGPDCSFASLVPDYLEGVSLEALGIMGAKCFARQDVFLLESEHIAEKVIPVETSIRSIFSTVKTKGHARFSDFVNADSDSRLIVVTFLAFLELYKRSMVSLVQDDLFGDIEISFIEGSSEQMLADETFDSTL